MREEWREIEDYPDYEVSNLGQVRSYKVRGHTDLLYEEPKPMGQHTDGSGHQYVVLSDRRGGHQVYVHRLVLEVFVSSCPEGMECRHLDGDPRNNRLDNLCWGTTQENADDKVRHGTQSRLCGEHNPNAVKPSASVVTEIKKRHAKGETFKSIAEDLGLNWKFVKGIVNNTHWSLRGDQTDSD